MNADKRNSNDNARYGNSRDIGYGEFPLPESIETKRDPLVEALTKQAEQLVFELAQMKEVLALCREERDYYRDQWDRANADRY